MAAKEETPGDVVKFEFSAFPADTLFFDRREGRERRADALHTTPAPHHAPQVLDGSTQAPERRAKKERRRRIDPTTFEKQYTDDELEFMNAMQRFKVQNGKSFPSHGEVLRVALSLGYRRVVRDEEIEQEPVEAASAELT
jgi:hypothetical protein